MWKIKGCPKCSGDMFIEQGEFGWNEHCLQCGFLREVQFENEKQESVLKTPSCKTLAKV